MPWKETDSMQERVRFVMLAKEEQIPFSQLCQLFLISRETGYKWLNRFETQGLDGLQDMSRRPQSNSKSVKASIVEVILKLRHQHPTWGPKKLAVLLKETEQVSLAPSTIGEILKRNGLVKKHFRRRHQFKAEAPDLSINGSNDVWCTDFKGHFLVGDGNRCHPLTLTDAYSRYILRCTSLATQSLKPAHKVFEEAFNTYGLPNIILSDNGTPFSSKAPGGLTTLSAWWVKLGITPVHIQAGHPEQNGRHERMHRTLKAETTRPPSKTLQEQQKAFDAFVQEYNEQRPHEALDQKRPSQLYQPSKREYPSKIHEPEYPGHFEVRYVRSNGEIKWKGENLYVSEVLTREAVGLEEIAEDTRLIYFYHLPIAVLLEKQRKMICLPSRLNQPKVSGMSPV